MSRILPIRTGWEATPGDTSFYPDDLPEEWRLAYFSSELYGVLLPPALWGRADADLLTQWAADVPVSFTFYLGIDDASPPASDRAVIQKGLGERFGGWVAGSDAFSALEAGAPTYARLGSLCDAAPSRARLLACEVPDGLHGDLRAARAWLDALSVAANGRPALALMGPARFGDVLRWQSLVHLLGLG
jgi:hypothetical protein